MILNRHSRFGPAAGALSLLLALCSCGDTGTDSHCEPDTVLLVPRDSISEGHMADDMLFGHPVDACFGPSGEVLILDQAAASVFAFEGDGSPLGSFGGRGEAPGEMGNPMSIETVEGFIVVRDAVKHGYLVFDAEYSLLSEVSHWPTGSPTDMSYCGDSSFAGLTTSLERSDAGMILQRQISLYRLGEAEPTAICWTSRDPLDPSDPSDFLRMTTESVVFAADGSGRTFIAEVSGEEYEISVHGPDGAIIGTISMEVQPVPKTDSELARERVFMESEMEIMGVEGIDEWRPEPFRPVIRGLGVDSLGRLWVHRGTEEVPVFDIFEGDSYQRLETPVVLPDSGYSWTFRMSPRGMVAWETDPSEGSFVFYLLEERSRDMQQLP